MEYKVVMTSDAEADLDAFVQYLLYDIKSLQAAGNLLDDFENTKNILAATAGSLKLCDNPKLSSLGYRRINFQKHRYFLLYRIEDNIVFIDNIFHELQDYESHLV